MGVDIGNPMAAVGQEHVSAICSGQGLGQGSRRDRELHPGIEIVDGDVDAVVALARPCGQTAGELLVGRVLNASCGVAQT